MQAEQERTETLLDRGNICRTAGEHSALLFSRCRNHSLAVTRRSPSRPAPPPRSAPRRTCPL
eukprot:1289661-Prymnesium_polylepis.1